MEVQRVARSIQNDLQTIQSAFTGGANQESVSAAKNVIDQVESKTSALGEYFAIFSRIVTTYCQLLVKDDPVFVAEHPKQRLRKLMLETISRLPTTDQSVKRNEKDISAMCFSLMKKDNEENASIALKILIDLYKQCRPTISTDVKDFLATVRLMYQSLPESMEHFFENPPHYKPGETPDETKIGFLTKMTYQVNSTNHVVASGGTTVTRTYIPKALNSLLVLIEAPIAVVLMYQLYRERLDDLFQIISSVLALAPSEEAKARTDFRRELYVNLIGVQIKSLSLVAYFVKLFPQNILPYSNDLLLGLLSTLKACPSEMAAYRKELIIAVRHISNTELKQAFVPHLTELFDDGILFGKGLTVREHIRPLGYHVIAELVHQLRQNLPYDTLAAAVYTYMTNIHDETLQLGAHVFSAKLVVTLIDCIRQTKDQSISSEEIRTLLLRILQSFTERLTTLAKYQLVELADTPVPENEDDRRTFEATFQENKQLLKLLICGAKHVTMYLFSQRHNGDVIQNRFQAEFGPAERKLYRTFGENALKAIDLYTLHTAKTNSGDTREKDLKETLEYFANTFLCLPLPAFKLVSGDLMEFLVERMHENHLLHHVAHPILTRQHYSFEFSSILVKHVISKMPEMGTPGKKSQLYLLLFKQLFGTVIHLRGENEEMLRPHLEAIVNGALKNAVHAKDPQNFFMLLRSLFRSISGGVHEKLYQEFLPILPKLLRQMNHLQAELHWPEMHDLFIELCLTVPVRLSYLLPLMNELMEPLVEALKGGPNLISQGLRTLELFVDNLQPDFLQEKIKPVRPQMMRALWDIINRDEVIRSSKERENCSTAAFRILGKFGGENRSSLREPPELAWNEHGNPAAQILVTEVFDKRIEFPVEKIVFDAVEIIRSKDSSDGARRAAVQYLIIVLTSFFEKDHREVVDRIKYNLFFTKANDTFRLQETTKLFKNGKQVEVPIKIIKKTIQGLVHSMQYENPEISSDSVRHVEYIIRHFVAVDCGFYASPIGQLHSTSEQNVKLVHVIDAIVSTLELQECNIDKIASAIFSLVKVGYETATLLLENGVKVTKLPFFVILAKKLQQICYERSWYVKAAARNVIDKLLDYLPKTWICEHSLELFKAMLFILRDLENEVSFGTVELTHKTLWKLIRHVVEVEKDKSNEIAKDALLKELVRDIISPFKIVREFAQKTLQKIAKEMSIETADIILDITEKHEGILDICPLQKNKGPMYHKAIPIQIGILNGSAFCLSMKPAVFKYDSEAKPECHTFLVEVFKIMSADESFISRDCYKKWLLKNDYGYENSLTPLRIEAMKVMSQCYYIDKLREDVFSSLYQNMTQLSQTNKDTELLNNAEQCLEFFLEKTSQARETEISMEFIHRELKPILEKITPRSCPRFEDMDCYIIERLAVLSRLLPKTLKLYDRFSQHFKETLKRMVENVHQNRAHQDLLKMAIATCEVFPLAQFVETSVGNLEGLMQQIIDAEDELGFYLVEIHPLLARFCIKVIEYDSPSVFGTILTEEKLSHPGWTRLVLQLLACDKTCKIHEALVEVVTKMINSAIKGNGNHKMMLFHAIKLLEEIMKTMEPVLPKFKPVIDRLVTLWTTPKYSDKMTNKNPNEDFKEVSFIATIFLKYVKAAPMETGVLFQLQKIFQIRNLCQFSEIKFWFRRQMAPSYSIKQRYFVLKEVFRCWNSLSLTERMKSDIMENIALPLLNHCRENGTLEELLGPPGDEDLVGLAIKMIFEWCPTSSDYLSVSVMHLAQFFVQHCVAYIPEKGDRFRIDRIIEFSRPCISATAGAMEPFTKFNGHLLLAMIADNYNIDPTMTLDLYERLLRAFGMHSKALVDQALDILVKKLSNDGRMDEVAHVTRRILVEEFQILRASAQLSHVVGLIQRHGHVFYSCDDKSALIGVMVPNMNRLSGSNFAEQRYLAVKLAVMLINWQKMSLNSDFPVSIVERRHGETIIHFLIRIMNQYFGNESSTQSADIISKCKEVLEAIYENKLWDNIPLRLQVIEKCFEAIDTTEEKTMAAISAMMTLRELVKIVPNSITELAAIQTTLINLISKADLRVYAGLKNLLKEIVAKYGSHEALEPLRRAILQQLNDGFSQCENSADPIPEMRRYLILVDSARGLPNLVEDVSVNLVRLFHRVTKEHVSSHLAQQHNTRGDADRQSGLIQSQILTIFDILKGSLGTINQEARKAFLSQQSMASVIQLIEKSDSSAIIEAIVDSTDNWIKSGTLTSKERGVILPKLYLNLSKRLQDLADEKLFDKEKLAKMQNKFLDIIYDIYYDERGMDGTGALGDLIPKLEGAFLWGLGHEDSRIRGKFFNLFSEWVPSQLHEAILFIFAVQGWDQLGSNFIPIALALLFTRVSREKPLISRSSPCFPCLSTLFENAKLLNESDDPSSGPDRHRRLFTDVSATITDINDNFSAETLFTALSELGFASPGLARHIWGLVFPCLWKCVPSKHQGAVGRYLRQFALAAHPTHHAEDVAAFVGSLINLQPSVELKAHHLRFLAQTYSLQPLAAITLEEIITKEALTGKKEPFDSDQPPGQSPAVVLSQLYEFIGESTWKTSVWETKCHFPDTPRALQLMEQAKYEEAQCLLEKLIQQEKNRPILSSRDNSEYDLWRESWITCCKELNSWESLNSHASHQNDTILAAECCWKLPNTWHIMKDAVTTLEQSCRNHLTWRVHLYKGYLSIRKCIDSREADFDIAVVDKHAKMAAQEAIKAWRKLPRIVSAAHAPLLRAAHQIVELNEAATIHESLSQSLIGTDKGKEQIKDIVKRWKNRLPLISDPLSHWSDIVTWHHHQYQSIVTQYEQIGTDQSNVGMHASATDFIYYARIARQHGQLTSALESLQQINHIPSVSVFDCYIRTIEQIKCYLTMNNQDDRHLKVIQETSLRFFKNPEQAEILALRAKLEAKVKTPNQEPNRTFSHAVQLHDSVAAWGHWGEYLVTENLERAVASNRPVAAHAAGALVALLQASRIQSASSYMANVIYCLTWDDTVAVLDVLDQCADSVPAIQWLPWVSQLVVSLCRTGINPELAERREDRLRSILHKMARKYSLAVYLPIRTKYLCLKLDSKSSKKSLESSMTPCCRLMYLLRDEFPPLLTSTEALIDSIRDVRDTWAEALLRQMRRLLRCCLVIQFANSNPATAASEASYIDLITSLRHSATDFQKLIQDAELDDILLKKLVEEFPRDLHLQQELESDKINIPKLAEAIPHCTSKFRKWIKKLESFIRYGKKYFYLNNWRYIDDDIEVPGQSLEPREPKTFIRVTKVMAKGHLVDQFDQIGKEISFLGNNGRLYKFLCFVDDHNPPAQSAEPRREERVAQLQRLLNPVLGASRLTSRRGLIIQSLKVVPLGPLQKLVQSVPSGQTLWDIYQKSCGKQDRDAPITSYFSRIASPQREAPPSEAVLRETFNSITHNYVAKDILLNWAKTTFPSHADFLTFKGRFLLSVAAQSVVSFSYSLSAVPPSRWLIDRSSGSVFVQSQKIESNRPKSIRLTPNMISFLQFCGSSHALVEAMQSTCQTLLSESVATNGISKAIIRDEEMIPDTNHWATATRTKANQVTTNLEKLNKDAGKIVTQASNPSMLARADPSLFPWL